MGCLCIPSLWDVYAPSVRVIFFDKEQGLTLMEPCEIPLVEYAACGAGACKSAGG